MHHIALCSTDLGHIAARSVCWDILSSADVCGTLERVPLTQQYSHVLLSWTICYD